MFAGVGAVGLLPPHAITDPIATKATALVAERIGRFIFTTPWTKECGDPPDD